MHAGEVWHDVVVTPAVAEVNEALRSGGSVWRPEGRRLWWLVKGNGIARHVTNSVVEKFLQASNGSWRVDYRVDNPASPDECLVRWDQ